MKVSNHSATGAPITCDVREGEAVRIESSGPVFGLLELSGWRLEGFDAGEFWVKFEVLPTLKKALQRSTSAMEMKSQMEQDN